MTQAMVGGVKTMLWQAAAIGLGIFFGAVLITAAGALVINVGLN